MVVANWLFLLLLVSYSLGERVSWNLHPQSRSALVWQDAQRRVLFVRVLRWLAVVLLRGGGHHGNDASRRCTAHKRSRERDCAGLSVHRPRDEMDSSRRKRCS